VDSLKEGHRRPNTSEVSLPTFPDYTSTQLLPDSITVSEADLSTKLLEHDRNAKNWTQPEPLIIPQDNGSTCDVGCALMGKLSKTPLNAIDQPTNYPRKSCIRLPMRFKGRQGGVYSGEEDDREWRPSTYCSAGAFRFKVI